MKKSVKIELVEKIYIVFSLLSFSGGPLTLILSGGASQGDGKEVLSSSPLLRIIVLLIYLTALFLLVKFNLWGKVINLLIKEKFILLLVVLAGASVFWSYAPEITVRRSITLAGTTLFGIYFATRYSLKQQLQLLGYTFCIVISLSFLFALLFPNYGIMGGPYHEGLWRGIYTHKNYLGKAMVLSLIVFLILATTIRKNRFFLWCGFSFSLILLIFSASKTALFCAVAILLPLGTYWAWQQSYSKAIPVFLAVIVVGGSVFLQITANIHLPVVLSNLSPTSETQSTSQVNLAKPDSPSTSNSQVSPSIPNASSVSGKELRTLTGRTELWPQVLNMIEKRPWLGYGYEAFWLGWNGPSAEVWRTVKNWKNPSHAHNGLLNLWLDLGLVGVLIFLSGFFVSLFRALSLIGLHRKPEKLWPLLYLTFIVLFNLTASTLVSSNDIYWVLYVAVVFSMLIAFETRTKVIEDA